MAAICFVATWIIRATHPNAGRNKDSGSGMDAFEMAKDFVERGLLSPGSAEWGQFSFDAVEKIGPSTWRVRSWVDSQNGFGALLRMNYTCEVTYTGNDNWRLEKLQRY